MARTTTTLKNSKAVRKHTESKKLAAEMKKEWRAELTKKLEVMVEAFELDEENAAMMRAFNSLTTHYSEGNAALILAQAAALGVTVRGLDDVGGFGVWNDRGRSIKQGEHKSIWIWGHGSKKDGESDTTVTDRSGKTRNVGNTTVPATENTKQFFFPVGLFHVGQTEDKAKADARRAAAAAAAK